MVWNVSKPLFERLKSGLQEGIAHSSGDLVLVERQSNMPLEPDVMFVSHFQEMARGHFTVRRLECKYGAEPVRAEYDRIKNA